ncbi:MAG: hypothetical protein A2150_06000 [Candidatus Muproteobacteria bacterium RBG_16_64_11]|uniref:Uncharacterized protein n=1 Tax=Candidatus Muproteobacteria bacterium RBG_16_64_11 TaxID=1817758 RepID=A0A1F6TIA4_9PROT|nr:MAG: hypothetical protein A2150_06000 [Candidatus Muproteobacteria bacterium RBG_16_64_11]
MLALCGALLATAAFAAGVYKWIDTDGKTHFGDRPPGDVAVQEVRIQTFDGPAEVETVAPEFVYGSVVIYTTEWCGVCKRAKAHLKSRGVVFTEFDIEKNGLAKAEFKRLNGKGVPLILVGDKRMSGFSATRLDKLLQEGGWHY